MAFLYSVGDVVKKKPECTIRPEMEYTVQELGTGAHTKRNRYKCISTAGYFHWIYEHEIAKPELKYDPTQMGDRDDDI